MRTLNLGILAHVDAGKTSLTEWLLYAAGVIDEIGSVDDGSTQTDTLALERQRGITIKSAVVSYLVDDVTINLIDTPGHPDFIAEVERVLGVLDGAVLVVSAVEGVQSQTRILMRTLRRLGIPTLFFVNKIDRTGARYEPVLEALRTRLASTILPMGSVSDLGSRSAAFSAFGAGDREHLEHTVEILAEHDDALLARYLDHESSLSSDGLRQRLAAQTRQLLVHPVFFGSAITGAGVDALTRAIVELLPAEHARVEDPVSGTVFKIDRGAAGERVAYVRLFTGSLHIRETVRVARRHPESAGERKVTAIEVFEDGMTVPTTTLAAGRIGRLWGLGEVRIGDALGRERPAAHETFAPPTLETVVVPSRGADRIRLHAALAQLAEQDPLINYRQDDSRQEVYVSLYGEVQKEVIQATLATDYGLDVSFTETTTICVERPVGVGSAVELIGAEQNPFLAGVGLQIEPAPAGAGVSYRLDKAVHGTMPLAFFSAVEETVHETLQQGTHGWQVTDCTVTLTHTHYYPRQSHMHATFDKSMSSTAADFRHLTPLVLMTALRRARTFVCEPVHRFRLELPADDLGTVLPVLGRLGAIPDTPVITGVLCVLEGAIPAAQIHELSQLLPGLTSGEGVLDSRFDRYEPVRGTAPSRRRTDHDPLDRKAYLLRVQRRTGAGAG